jgi:GNAT superfamily N-acetyltransferase
MASIDALRLTPLTERDINGCMALSAEAGWNQNPDDWALFMRHGTVFGLAGEGAEPVATGAILPYPQDFAWISMVLVTVSRRRERIGTRILEACCEEITRHHLVAVLDATPAGERVYRPLGFEPIFKLSRWQGVGSGAAVLPPGIRPMQDRDIAAIATLDAAAFGARRPFLIENFFRRAPHLAFATDDASGFVLARPGRVATQIGPVVATDDAVAAKLLAASLDAACGPVLLDLADRWDHLGALLARRGFTVQRPYLRMGLGRALPFGDPDRTFIVAGPEFG